MVYVDSYNPFWAVTLNELVIPRLPVDVKIYERFPGIITIERRVVKARYRIKRNKCILLVKEKWHVLLTTAYSSQEAFNNTLKVFKIIKE